MTTKKPDNVVFDKEKQLYHAKLIPYPTTVGSPTINTNDISTFKKKKTEKVQKIFDARYENLTKEYLKLMDEIRINDIVYNSKFSFEPIVGEIYHLYTDKNNKHFLSIISPTEWAMKYIFSVKLNSDHIWDLVV